MLNAQMLPVNPASTRPARPLLIITEGVLDIVFLTKLSQIIHTAHSQLPDLQQLVSQGESIFLPAGGGDLSAWITRLSPLGCKQFFLFDREQHPETAVRERIVAQINERVGCHAVLTRKRSLENYLHPAAIEATFGISIELADDTAVAELVTRSLPYVSSQWPTMSPRHRQRLIYRTKRRLNTEAVQHMTAELFAERDPAGELIKWLRTIASLVTCL